MVSNKLQKKWYSEADEIAEILQVFTDGYAPRFMLTFFSATKEEADRIIGKPAKLMKILGLFKETWRLAIKKSLPPCGINDFRALLSEASVTWEVGGCRGAKVKTLRKVWRVQ